MNLKTKKKKSEPSNPSNLPLKLINYKGVNLTIWNLSGKSEPLRSVIKDKVDALIFVVDSVDKDKFEDAAKKLETIIQEDNMEDSVILLFANKQDLDGAASPKEVQEKLGMIQLKKIIWLCQGSNSLSGQGVDAGFDWLISALKKDK